MVLRGACYTEFEGKWATSESKPVWDGQRDLRSSEGRGAEGHRGEAQKAMDAREAKERFKNADDMYREGRYGQALVLLDSLNEQYPNTKNIMYPRALCLAKVGRVDEAVVVCDELVARFGHKRAAALKAKLTPRQTVMPPSIAAIPEFGEPAVSAVPRLQAAPRPFFLSVRFLVGTAVIVVAAITVLAYLFVPRDKFEALLKAAPTVARPETPSATERVETEGGAQKSAALRLFADILGRTGIFILLYFAQVILTIYVTLLIGRKIGNRPFGLGLLIVIGVGILVGVVQVFCCPLIGTFVALLILYKVFDFDLTDVIVFVFLGIVLSFATKYLAEHYIFAGLDTAIKTFVEEKAASKGELPTASTVPEAAILVDGQSYDWDGVPVFASVSKGEYGADTYGVQTLKLAHDSANVYVLLQLGVGIDEKFDAEYQRSGTVSSGSIGHLGIAVPGTTYRIWLPTGFVQTTDPATGTAVMYPTVDAEVARIDPSTGASQTVLEVDSAKNPDSIAFAGKDLELKLPIGPLGFPTDQMASVTLDPF